MVLTIVFFLILIVFMLLLVINKTFINKMNKFEGIIKNQEDNKHMFLSLKKRKERFLKSLIRRSILSKFYLYGKQYINKDYKIISIYSLIFLIVLIYFTFSFIPKVNALPELIGIIILKVDEFLVNFNIEIVKTIRNHPIECREILDLAIKSVGILLSVSLTLYFFTYRVRRTIAISSNLVLQGSLPILLFIFFTFIYGQLYIITTSESSLADNQVDKMRLIVWIMLYIISISLGLSKVIAGMLRSIDYIYILKFLLKNLEHTINVICYSDVGRKNKNIKSYWNNKNEKMLKVLYEFINSTIESIYQTLMQVVDKNIGDSLREYFIFWEEFITKFMQGDTNTRLRSYVPYDNLRSISKEKFQRVYSTIIENHADLILNLYKKNRVNDAQQALRLFDILRPSIRNTEIYEAYIKQFRQLVVVVNKECPLLINTMLELLEKISKENIKENIGIQIYKEVMLQIVEEDDITKLSLFAYSLLNTIEKENYKQQDYINKRTRNPKLMQLYTANTSNISNNISQKFVKSIIFTYLQMILKSVEVGKYGSTGFLIKMCVTNFNKPYNVSLFNVAFIEFLQNEEKRNPYITRSVFSLNDINPKFNRETLQYCTHKLSVLLYGQQKYAVINNLPGQEFSYSQFEDSNYLPIKLAMVNCNYLLYILKKIENANDKYGLLYLKDQEFFDSLKVELNSISINNNIFEHSYINGR
jgi:hypothetical protein